MSIRRTIRTGSVLLVAVTCLACSSDVPTAAPPGALEAAETRVVDVQSALDGWAGASDLTTAQDAAETVSNLVTGPGVRLYGDTDADGVVVGEVGEGLLPQESGGDGLALPLEDCAGPDLLGGSWDDAGARWETFFTALDAWTPSNNTFPDLPSHAQRVVGWAQLTLETTNLDDAREYSGHAQLHVDAVRDALAGCSPAS